MFDRSIDPRVKLFLPFFFFPSTEPPLRRYSTGQWVLIDRSLGGPFERGHNAKWREIGVGRSMGEEQGGGDQGEEIVRKKKKKKGGDRETTVLLLGNGPFKLDEKF